MNEQLTAVFQRVPEGYIAFVEELPGANTQGDTLEEARTNLHEGVQLVLEANRALAEEFLKNKTVIRNVSTTLRHLPWAFSVEPHLSELRQGDASFPWNPAQLHIPQRSTRPIGRPRSRSWRLRPPARPIVSSAG
jgi:predicted RNase H-like HicB family nuclease